MNKCREAFNKWVFDNQETASDREREVWQAAWNARGKVDAEICRTSMHVELAQLSIEQEQCE